MLRIVSVALSTVFIVSVFAAVLVHVLVLQAKMASLHGDQLRQAVTLPVTHTR